MKLTKDYDMYKIKDPDEDMSKTEQEDKSQDGKGLDDEEDSISIMATFKEIVKEAKYLPITFKSIEAPKQIQINRDLVSNWTPIIPLAGKVIWMSLL